MPVQRERRATGAAEPVVIGSGGMAAQSPRVTGGRMESHVGGGTGLQGEAS